MNSNSQSGNFYSHNCCICTAYCGHTGAHQFCPDHQGNVIYPNIPNTQLPSLSTPANSLNALTSFKFQDPRIDEMLKLLKEMRTLLGEINSNNCNV